MCIANIFKNGQNPTKIDKIGKVGKIQISKFRHKMGKISHYALQIFRKIRHLWRKRLMDRDHWWLWVWAIGHCDAATEVGNRRTKGRPGEDQAARRARLRSNDVGKRQKKDKNHLLIHPWKKPWVPFVTLPKKLQARMGINQKASVFLERPKIQLFLEGPLGLFRLFGT